MENTKLLFNEQISVGTADQAFRLWAALLLTNGISQKSRDGGVCGEVINAVTTIMDPTRNIVKGKSMRYAIGEMLWYMSGSNRLEEIQKYTSGWDRMSDDGITVNSNYGYCIKHKFGFDQWEYVADLLDKDNETRQAVIHIKEPSNEQSKDVNCTVCLQFLIRDEKLFLTTYMRSNDIWFGFPYDVFQFTNMQVLMSMELGVGLGCYTHIAGSLHLYERDRENVEAICNSVTN